MKTEHGITFKRDEDRKLGLLLSEEESKKIINEWIKEDEDKLKALCGYYGIETNIGMYRSLALALAREFLPEKKKPKPPVKWNSMTGGALVVEVERLDR
ncbi:hypothetical protein JV46_25520 [Solemya velum gill symbiont]|uniref:Uncharacterized protein n=1 Tax=Solemya velum gill symbiont TaxID=2340 RepID=A0A0B0H9H5_SOVGS|nr:hypothetical protein [Solemya velum gill symbiont]KHF24519.1 hypothetical protein JV46_25520 [Solemya velum gill symbiont]